MQFIEPDHPEWSKLWQSLEAITGDCAETCPETGECWQYMGSTVVNVPVLRDETTPVVAHQFRHRHRPAGCVPIRGLCGDSGGYRVYLDIAASLDVAPDNGVAAGLLVNVRARLYEVTSREPVPCHP
ncbi:MAG: hypothetical protein HQ567_16005 [Candidatus Nealsonbacteria bacterium]|nr:hypothetical protein [Candidatus Nealsonbacteria bacterium]